MTGVSCHAVRVAVSRCTTRRNGGAPVADWREREPGLLKQTCEEVLPVTAMLSRADDGDAITRRAIPSRPGYFATADGHVFHAGLGRNLREHASRFGYPRVRFFLGQRRHQRVHVHQLVAEAFHGPCPEGLQVRHLNGDRADNRPENLTYGTAEDNAQDRADHGTTARGLRAANARHTHAEVQRARRLIAAGHSQRSVAASFGVAQSTVWRWASGRQRDERMTAPAPVPDDAQHWRDSALCAQVDTEMFFPEKGGSTREAKRICATCDVRAQCLQYALDGEERFGIWGGKSERERRRLNRARG